MAASHPGERSSARSRRFRVERVYEDATPGRFRVLVDRLWPRGVKKDEASLDEWSKDVSPSTELRRWYGHDTARYAEFERRYRDELGRPPAAQQVDRLLRTARSRLVTLVTATRDVEHSGARVLCDVLEETRRRRKS